jgi:glycosyltransferase involved in cell wall biosynthesis
MRISIVIPVKNEEKNVQILFSEIKEVFKTKDYEVVFVDDGSTDRTFERLSSIKDKHLMIVKLRKSFGQSAGLLAGFDNASGEIIVTMDGDLQNDPKDIPKLLAKLDEGYDCVSGWRKKRKDKLWVSLMSRTSNFLRHVLINDKINDSGCSLKAYRKECLEGIELYGEMHRYIVSLVYLKGFKIAEIEVNHRERASGKTNYGIFKVVKGFLDLWGVWFWQKFSGRPLHLFGLIGITSMFLGVLAGIEAIYAKIAEHLSFNRNFFSIISVFLFMIGIQFFVTGLLADISLKNYMKGKKAYAVEKVVENK